MLSSRALESNHTSMRSGTFVAILFGVSGVGISLAHATPLSSSDESRARQSIRELSKPSDGYESFMTIAMAAWDRKCKDSPETPECHLTECDVQPKDCRSGRALLFRGEGRLHSTPSVSDLVRTHWAGSSFVTDAHSSKPVDELISEINRIRPIEMYPVDEGDQVVLIRDPKEARHRWVYKEIEQVEFKGVQSSIDPLL